MSPCCKNLAHAKLRLPCMLLTPNGQDPCCNRRAASLAQHLGIDGVLEDVVGVVPPLHRLEALQVGGAAHLGGGVGKLDACGGAWELWV